MTLKYTILVGVILLALGLYAGRKLHRRIRLVWIILPLLILALLAYLPLDKREDNQEAAGLFGRIESSANLSERDAEMFRALTVAPPRVRRQVLSLAFRSSTNAGIALPRLGFLLQACVGLDSAFDTRQSLWDDVVRPAVAKRPSLEILRLAASTADFLQSATQAVNQITPPLLSILQKEPSFANRSLLVNELGPLADRMQPAQARILADALLRQMAEERKPIEVAALATNLVPAVKRAGPAAFEPVISRALSIMEAGTNGNLSVVVAQGLAGLSEQMTPAQLWRTAHGLADGWLESDGRSRPAVTSSLLGVASRLRADDQQKLVSYLTSTIKGHPVDLFYLDWSKALAPVLNQCAMGMSKQRCAAVVLEWIQEPPGNFSDLFWGRLITPMTSGMGPEDVQPLVEALITRILQTKGQAMGWYSSRFAALADHLDSERAQVWVQLLVSRLLGPDAGAEWDPLVLYLSIVSARLDSERANALAQQLLPAMQPPDVGRILGVSKILAPVAARLDATHTARLVDGLLAAMGSRKNVYRVNAVAEQLAPVADRVSPDLLQPVLEQLVAAMEKETNADNVRILSSGLAALAGYLDRTQAGRAGEGIVRAIEQAPLKYFAQTTNTIEALAKRIKSEDARRAVAFLLERGLSRRGPDTYLALKCAPRLMSGLTSDMAESFVNDVTAPLGREKDLSAVCLRIRAATPLAQALRQDQVRLLSDRLLRTLEADTNNSALTPLLLATAPKYSDRWNSPRVFVTRQESRLELFAVRTLCEALATNLSKMPPADAADISGHLAARFIQQGWISPLGFDEHFAEALQYASEQTLKEILKTPFAIGGLRDNTLRALELKASSNHQPGARSVN